MDCNQIEAMSRLFIALASFISAVTTLIGSILKTLKEEESKKNEGNNNNSTN